MADLIRCPTCGSVVPENARFCPGCDAPRSHVELELRRASELTGVPYADLLDRARLEDQARKDTQIAGHASTVAMPVRDERPGWQKVLFLFVGVAVAVVVYGLVAGGATGGTSGSPANHQVEYRITMTNSLEVSLTYTNAQGGTEQKRTYAAYGSWSETFTMRPGSHAYISVQNLNSSGGAKCEIFVDNQVWRTSESTGGYTIATCSGRVGEQ